MIVQSFWVRDEIGLNSKCLLRDWRIGWFRKIFISLKEKAVTVLNLKLIQVKDGDCFFKCPLSFVGIFRWCIAELRLINSVRKSIQLSSQIYPTKKKRIQLHFPIFLKITVNSVNLPILIFSVLIEQCIL